MTEDELLDQRIEYLVEQHHQKQSRGYKHYVIAAVGLVVAIAAYELALIAHVI